MVSYTHELTEGETACGVTMEQVRELLVKVLVKGHGEDTRVIFPETTSPALASSVARCALAGPATYAGHNQLGQPVYRVDSNPER